MNSWFVALLGGVVIGLSASALLLFNGRIAGISGILGGYLILFPKNRVRVLTRGGIMSVPALVVLGFWIVIQLISGFGSVATTAETGGVAYLAHVGGFFAGMLLVKPMTMGRPTLA